MAEFSKLVITKKGEGLTAKALAGVTGMVFTNVSLSSTAYTAEELEGLESLTDIKQTSPVSHVEAANTEQLTVESAFTNTDLADGYYVKTVGLYASHPDTGEVLYAVAIEQTGSSYMPPYKGTTVSGVIVKLVVSVGNSANVSLAVDPGVAATVADLKRIQDSLDAIKADLASATDLKQVQDSLDAVKADLTTVKTDLKRVKIKADGDTPIASYTRTLSADGWDAATKTCKWAVMNVNWDGDFIVGLADTATEEQAKAAGKAGIWAVNLGDHHLTFKCDTLPTIDIPISILAIGTDKRGEIFWQ